jgi:hypothetical protein
MLVSLLDGADVKRDGVSHVPLMGKDAVDRGVDPVESTKVAAQRSGTYPTLTKRDQLEHIRAVTLEEFARLRQEIDNHMQFASALVGVCLTALAAGLALSEQHPDILIALGVVVPNPWTEPGAGSIPNSP